MILKDIYKVFGDSLPKSRSHYSAHACKPYSMLEISKEFKTWNNFVLEYNKYAIEQRNAKVKTIEKKVVKKVTKEVK